MSDERMLSDRIDVLARTLGGAVQRHRWDKTSGGALTDATTGEAFWTVVARYAHALGADAGDGSDRLHGPVTVLGGAR